jgi:16S rRNA processing protein RimM
VQGDALGQVADMMDNGVQSILRITPVPDAAAEMKAPERLIPYVDQYVKTVDLAAKKITVDWGLDY